MLGSQWDGCGLSGGQWQRLALARVWLSGRFFWILDEPTAAIDAQAEQEIYEDIIHGRPRNTTVILISHRPQVLKHVDCIFVIDKGDIIQHGTYAELMADTKGLFYQLSKRDGSA